MQGRGIRSQGRQTGRRANTTCEGRCTHLHASGFLPVHSVAGGALIAHDAVVSGSALAHSAADEARAMARAHRLVLAGRWARLNAEWAVHGTAAGIRARGVETLLAILTQPIAALCTQSSQRQHGRTTNNSTARLHSPPTWLYDSIWPNTT